MTDFGTKFVRAAFPADLKDGGVYGTRNGRVVKLGHNDSVSWPWVGHIDGQPRAGGLVLRYGDHGIVDSQSNPRVVDSGYDIVTVRVVNEEAPAPEDEVWVTRDGKAIAVGDLSEAHAKNIVRMFARALKKRAAALAYRRKLRQEVRSLMAEADREYWEAVGEDRKWGSD